MRAPCSVLAALAALTLAACAAGAPPAPPPEPFRGVWRLVELDGAPAAFPITLTVGAARVEGVAPCNTYFGAWSRTGDALTVGPLAATRRACPDLALEQTYLGLLTDTASAEGGGGALTLRDAGGRPLMRFERVKPGA